MKFFFFSLNSFKIFGGILRYRLLLSLSVHKIILKVYERSLQGLILSGNTAYTVFFFNLTNLIFFSCVNKKQKQKINGVFERVVVVLCVCVCVLREKRRERERERRRERERKTEREREREREGERDTTLFIHN